MMERQDLERLLTELRTAGTDHASVEAKRSEGGLPRTISETLSAFANTDGGIVLLGVDEQQGAFDVTGVGDPAAIQHDLQSACAELEPALRPRISVVDYDGRAVVVAEVAPISRSERPCHRRSEGPYNSSYIRVGDADQWMTNAEVDELRAARSTHDHSRRQAPEHAALAAAAVADFGEQLRRRSGRYGAADDDAVARAWGLVDDGRPTLAGLLALGEEPAAASPAARIAYRRLPRADAPHGARYAARHLEGRVGELLDAALAQLREDLDEVQVTRGGHVYDELDIPAVALREIIGNALLHRSLSEPMETASVAIEVSDEAVVVTSPGGLHVGAETALLGLDSISGVRNLTLVRVCEQLTTPSGARIVENQASGIATADRECRQLGTMPALFIDRPANFQAILLRRALDTEGAERALHAAGVEPAPDFVRLIAVAQRLQQTVRDTPLSGLERLVLDARLAARTLAPSTVEDGAAALRQLEDAGVLERRHTRHGSFWAVREPAVDGGEQQPAPPGGRTSETRTRESRRDRVGDLVLAIADSDTGELSSSQLGPLLGLTSTRSISGWITKAAQRELIEPTTENPYDPNRAYRLTAGGAALAERLREQRPPRTAT